VLVGGADADIDRRLQRFGALSSRPVEDFVHNLKPASPLRGRAVSEASACSSAWRNVTFETRKL
jgi:hypothetical protein